VLTPARAALIALAESSETTEEQRGEETPQQRLVRGLELALGALRDGALAPPQPRQGWISDEEACRVLNIRAKTRKARLRRLRQLAEGKAWLAKVGRSYSVEVAGLGRFLATR
jgi:hypothetical protein